MFGIGLGIYNIGDAMTLEGIFKHGVETAPVLFNESGALAPMWIGETKDGMIIPMVCPFHTIDEKDMMVEAIKILFKQRGVVRHVSLVEAWMVEANEIPESIKLGGDAASHPERREVIHIVAEDADGKQLCGHYFILRPENGPPKLSEFKRIDGSRLEGRFTGLLA